MSIDIIPHKVRVLLSVGSATNSDFLFHFTICNSVLPLLKRLLCHILEDCIPEGCGVGETLKTMNAVPIMLEVSDIEVCI